MAPTDNLRYRILNRDGTYNIERSGMRQARVSDLYHWLLSMRTSRFLLVMAGAFLIANFIFAVGYTLAGPTALEGVTDTSVPGRFAEAFFFSVQTLDTIGYGKVAPHGLVANLLVTLEALTGLTGLALATGLLFARFSRPTARVTFSQVAIIADHDGTPSLLFRVANRRRNQIVEARVGVVLARTEETLEGQEFRNLYDLELERAQSPIFALSWTIVHPIRPGSPLHGITPASLAASGAEILVTLTGIDDVFFQTIHTRFSYTAEEVVWGKAFADIIFRREGKVRMELERIHDVVDLVEDHS